MASPFDSQHNAIRARIEYYADKYSIDRTHAIWQIWQESKFNPRASSGLAIGIAQFTPATAARFDVNVWDVESSLDGWGRYMRFLLNRYSGTYWLALAGYHSGEGNADKFKAAGQIPASHPNARNYVNIILGNVGAANQPALGNVGAANQPASISPWLIVVGVGVYLILE